MHDVSTNKSLVATQFMQSMQVSYWTEKRCMTYQASCGRRTICVGVVDRRKAYIEYTQK